MKEGNLENISKLIFKRQGRLINRIQGKLKGVKPFKQPQLDPLEELYHIENSGYLVDPNQTMQELGREGARKLFDRYMELKERYSA